MRKIILFFSFTVAALVFIYYLRPKPESPKFETPEISLPIYLIDLEYKINQEEKEVIGLKPDNEARIVWADSTKKQKTKISILYLHGFTASPNDGTPVHEQLARKFGANTYLFRNRIMALNGVTLR